VARKNNHKKRKNSINEWEDYSDIAGKGTSRKDRRRERSIGKSNLKKLINGHVENEHYMDNLDK